MIQFYESMLNNTFVALLLLAFGLFCIIKGGDLFVDSSIWIAKITGIPSIIIGATIVSIGTTLPECLVSIIAVVEGLQASDPLAMAELNSMAVANSLGSIICNTSLILAIVLCVRPPKAESKSFSVFASYLIGVSMLLVIFSLNGKIDLYEAILLLVLFVGFIVLNVFDAKKELAIVTDLEIVEKNEAEKESKAKMIIFFILGAAGIALGARLLVDSGTVFATKIGISSQVIGITIIAIGTSLPEFVTSITSLKKKDSSIGIGNIVGANIINATMIMGSIGVISGGAMMLDNITKNLTIFVVLGISIVLCVPAMIKKKTFKWQGYVMLAIYIGFITTNIILSTKG